MGTATVVSGALFYLTGVDHVVCHAIPTPTGQCIRTPLQLLPPKWWEMLEQEVQDMLCLGVMKGCVAPSEVL